jgi:hypothetical protein
MRMRDIQWVYDIAPMLASALALSAQREEETPQSKRCELWMQKVIAVPLVGREWLCIGVVLEAHWMRQVASHKNVSFCGWERLHHSHDEPTRYFIPPTFR